MPDPISYTQTAGQLSLDTPLGKDVLLLTQLDGHEEVSRLFSFHLQMHSTNDSISPKEIVGKGVTVTLKMLDSSERYFNGVVSRFSYTGTDDRFSYYTAEIVPRLWFLTLNADCRIFQGKSVPDIIKEVFGDLGFSDFETSEIKGSHPKWDYCVQYRETSFNFVSRLMEQEGIFYYFRHGQGKHVLVLADQMGAFKDAVENQLSYAARPDPSQKSDKITAWEHRYQYHSGKWAQTDYNFETPSADLMAKTNTVVQWDQIRKYELYDYPGEYELKQTGDDEVKIRMEEQEVPHEVVEGSSLCRSFSPGGKFTVTDHRVKAEEGNTYAILTVRHSASEGSTYTTAGGAATEYHNTFSSIPIATTFRPARLTPKPVVQGVQPAVVVGPAGEEIYTDKYSRVKVQFFWDRKGQKDDKSSCWIRVAQAWAGKNWGAITIPRIGQEVLVEFLEGDPDRPIITGSVYNAEQTVPYPLPDEKTKSTLKSNTSKGGIGFNEIRFEDLKDKEQIFMHAERNMDVRVKNDSMERVIGDRHLIVGGEKDGAKSGDQKEMVYQDKHLKVHRNQVEHVGGDMQLLVGGVDGPGNQDIVIKAVKKELVEGDNHLHVKGARNEKVDGDQSLTVGGSQQEKVGMKHAVDSGQEIHLKAGMTVVIEAGMQLSLKGPGGFVDIGPAGVTIQGTMVLINSGGAAGSGSGSSPESPEDAKEASPAEPTPADDAKTGQKSAKS